MVTRKLSMEEQFISNWNEYRIICLNNIKEANKILEKHNEIVKIPGASIYNADDIQNAETILKTLNDIKEKLIPYINPLKNLHTTEEKLLNIFQEMSSVYTSTIEFLLHLNFILANKYFSLFEKTSQKYKKYDAISKAYQYIETSKSMLQNTEYTDYLKNKYPTNLENFYNYIKESYLSIERKNDRSSDELQSLLIQARNTKNKDRAYDIFQKALDIAKTANNPEQQFLILWEQGRVYVDSIKELKEILNKHNNDKAVYQSEFILKRISNSFIAALKVSKEITTSTKIDPQLRSIYIDLQIIAQLMVYLSQDASISKKWEKRKELIDEANRLYVEGLELTKQYDPIQEIHIHFRHIVLKAEIDKASQALVTDKEKEEATIMKQHEEALLKKQTDEKYQKKFSDPLLLFKNEKKIKSNKKHKRSQKKKKETAKNNSLDSVSASSIPQNVLNTKATQENATAESHSISLDKTSRENCPIYLTIEWKYELQENNNISLENLLEQLKIAKNSEDKTRIYTNIAEYYRSEAKRQPKMAIQHLENATECLSKALKLKIVKSENNKHTNILLSWINILLEDTTHLIAFEKKTAVGKGNMKLQALDARVKRLHDMKVNYLESKKHPNAFIKNNFFNSNSEPQCSLTRNLSANSFFDVALEGGHRVKKLS